MFSDFVLDHKAVLGDKLDTPRISLSPWAGFLSVDRAISKASGKVR